MVVGTGVGVPVDAGELCDRLELVRQELSMLARSPFGAFTEPEAARVVAGVECVNRLSEALVTECAGGIDAAQTWTASGYQTFSRWWTLHTHRRTSTSNATRLLGRDLHERLPLTARALVEGRLSGEHAKVLARYTKTEVQRDQLLDESMGEAFLVTQAQKMTVEDFTRAVKAWALRTDPEAGDRGWREQGAQQELFVAPVLDGTDVRGWLGLEEGQVVLEALNAIIGVPAANDDRTPAQRRAAALVHLCRLFLDGGLAQPGSRIRPHIAITIDFATLERLINATAPDCTFSEVFGRLLATRPTAPADDEDSPSVKPGGAEGSGGSGGTAGSGDPGRVEIGARTRPGCGGGQAFGLRGSGQGDSDASEQANLRGDDGDGGGRAGCCGGVVIGADLDHGLVRGAAPATFADGTPIPYGQLAKLLCDGEFHRVIFGPEGQVLDSGRTQRLFTAAQTRAIIARDTRCQYPGCAAPPGQGEIHHCLWWYHQGRTSTDNGILLCWWHHTLVHQRHLRITRHDHPGRSWWEFTTIDGRPVLKVGAPADTYASPDLQPPHPHRRE